MENLIFIDVILQMMDYMGFKKAPNYLVEEVLDAFEEQDIFLEELEIVKKNAKDNIEATLSDYKKKPIGFKSRIARAHYTYNCLVQWEKELLDKLDATTTCYVCGRKITEDEVAMSWDNQDCTATEAVCKNCYGED